MAYQNAKDILPPHLLRQLQRYTQGCLLYIPRREETTPVGWGGRNGTRGYYTNRNENIRTLSESGMTVVELADRYALSVESIRKILRSHRERK